MSFREVYQGTWDTNPLLDEIIEQTPRNYNIIPIHPIGGVTSISNIITEQENKGYELKAYIESPMPHGSNSIPSLLIFKKDSFPILMGQFELIRKIIYEDKWYRKVIKKLKSLLKRCK